MGIRTIARLGSGEHVFANKEHLKVPIPVQLGHTAEQLPRLQVNIEDMDARTILVTEHISQLWIVHHYWPAASQFHKVMGSKRRMLEIALSKDYFAVHVHHTDLSRLEAHALQSVLPCVKYLSNPVPFTHLLIDFLMKALPGTQTSLLSRFDVLKSLIF